MYDDERLGFATPPGIQDDEEEQAPSSVFDRFKAATTPSDPQPDQDAPVEAPVEGSQGSGVLDRFKAATSPTQDAPAPVQVDTPAAPVQEAPTPVQVDTPPAKRPEPELPPELMGDYTAPVDRSDPRSVGRQSAQQNFDQRQIEDAERPAKEAEMLAALEGGDQEVIASADIGEYIAMDMWDNRKYDDAKELYDKIIQRPNVEFVAGVGPLSTDLDAVYVTEDGRRELIPKPKRDIISPSGIIEGIVQAVVPGGVTMEDVFEKTRSAILDPDAEASIGDKLFYGSSEQIIAFGVASASILDLAAGAFGKESGLGESIEDFGINVDNGDSFGNAVVSDVVPLLAIGGGAASAVKETLKNSSVLFSRAMALFGAEVAMSASVPTEDGTLAIGENSFLGISDGVDFGDSNAAKTIEHRVNTLTEGVMLGFGASTGARLARTIYGAGTFITKGITGAFSPKQMERDSFNRVQSILTGVDLSASKADVSRKAEEVATIIRENKEEFYEGLQDFLGDESTVKFDTLSSFMRGMMDESTESKSKWLEFNRIARYFQAFSGREFTNFDNAAANPTRTVEQVTDGMSEVNGGTARRDQVPEVLADTTNQRIDGLNRDVDIATADLDRQRDFLISQVENDPLIGDLLVEANKALPLARQGNMTNIRRDMASSIRSTYEGLKETKNELYGRITGGTVDGRKLMQQLDRLPRDFLDSTARMNDTTAINKLFNMRKQAQAAVDDAAEQGLQLDVYDVFNRLLESPANNADYGFFYNEVRQELRDAAQDLGRGSAVGSTGASRGLLDVVRYIDNDMINDLSDVPDDLVADVAAAKDFYQNTYAPLFGQRGALAEYPKIHNETYNRGFGDLSAAAEIDTLIRGNIESGPMNADKMRAVFDASERPEQLMDYIVADFVEDVATQVQAVGGMENFDLSNILKTIQPMAAVIQEVAPGKAAQFDDMLQRIIDAPNDRATLEATIKEVTELAEVAKNDAMNSELRFFFDQDVLPTEIRATSNPAAAFEKMFSSTESTRYVDQYLAKADELDPGSRALVREGLRVAYSRHLRNEIVTSTRQRAGDFPLSQIKGRKAMEVDTQTLAIGDAIFADKPQVMESLRSLTATALQLGQVKASKPVNSLSGTETTRRAMESVNRLLNSTIGQLSTKSARVRSAVQTALQSTEANEAAARIMDKIITDPDEYLRLYEKYGAGGRDVNNAPDLVRFFTSALAKSDIDRPSEVDQMMQE